jgi:hypothetical protein
MIANARAVSSPKYSISHLEVKYIGEDANRWNDLLSNKSSAKEIDELDEVLAAQQQFRSESPSPATASSSSSPSAHPTYKRTASLERIQSTAPSSSASGQRPSVVPQRPHAASAAPPPVRHATPPAGSSSSSSSASPTVRVQVPPRSIAQNGSKAFNMPSREPPKRFPTPPISVCRYLYLACLDTVQSAHQPNSHANLQLQ